MNQQIKFGDTVQLNANFENYEYKDTWVDSDGVYDEKAFKIRQPQRGIEYKVTKVYGDKDKWISLKGLTGAYPGKFFDIINQYCKIKS